MKTRMLAVAAGSWLLAMSAAPTMGQGLAKLEKPEDVGLSAERLERIGARMRQGVEKGEMPGAVVLVARHGHVAYFKAFGMRDPEAKAAMGTDAIFRIASMTKPITSLAIMMLAEEGKLSIADPAEKYLPEFKDLKVGTVAPGADGKPAVTLAPQRRPMTVQDLLRHTSGLTYGAGGDNPLKQAYVDAKVSDRSQTNAELVTKLSKLALLFQPGTTWEYSVSTDVLGRIVEVVSGQPLDRFFEERILKPLKMHDTGFSVPAEKAGRGARPHREGAKNELPNVPLVTDVANYKSGGGGMVSTAADYARFCQFWLNGGQLDGVRLVSRKTIELMSNDHLPPGTRMGPDMARFEALTPSREMGQGFGLGFAVRNDPGMSPLHGSVGDIFWGGAFGTYFWIDPAEGLFAILMMQSPAARLPYRYLMRELVYQAIVD